MTTQTSERLEIDHPGFQPGEWRLYALIRGEPTKENHGWGARAPDGSKIDVHRAQPGPVETVTSASWKGFTAVLRLGHGGDLTLLRFDYDDSDLPPRIVNERIEGDFYAVLKAIFNGPRLYVPFRDGIFVQDRTKWLHEDYVGSSPLATELRPGCHPAYPGLPRLWFE